MIGWRRFRLGILLSAIGLLVLVGAAVQLWRTFPEPEPAAVATSNFGVVPGSPVSSPERPSSSSAAVRNPEPAAVNWTHGVPTDTHLRVDRLGVNAPIDAVAVNSAELGVPLDPARLGWWDAGSSPGARVGNIVIDGHINYAGRAGALSVLPRAHAGDLVIISSGGREFRYVVRAVRSYPKATGLPNEIFRRTGPPALVMITCGGSFDSSAHSYVDNIVAYAEPA